PQLSPSKIIPLTEAVNGSNRPAKVNPIGQRGAMLKPTPHVAIHKTTRESEQMITSARRARHVPKATGMICCGGTRVARGMASTRPQVKANQNPDVRYAAAVAFASSRATA